MMLWINSLKPIDAIWRSGLQSALVQVMVCCLASSSHYLNQYSLLIKKVLWHSPKGNFTGKTWTYPSPKYIWKLHIQYYSHISQGSVGSCSFILLKPCGKMTCKCMGILHELKVCLTFYRCYPCYAVHNIMLSKTPIYPEATLYQWLSATLR